MTLASNMLLNRRDNFLKLCHRDVTDKDIARLRNASLTKKEMFNSKVLSEVEQNFIQWSQINRDPAFKKHTVDSYGSRSFADSKTKDNLVPTTPIEALPEGVGAGGSDYMEAPFRRLLESVGKLQSTSQGSSCFKARLFSSIQTKTTSDPVSGNQKQLFNSSKTKSFAGGSSTNGSKKGSVSGSKQELSRILQSFVSGSKSRKQIASSNRSQCGKYIFACSHLQNGNRGSQSGFSSDRRVGGFHRSHRHLFSCTHTPKVSKISTLSCTGSGLSVQRPTLRHCDCSIGVHSSGERGQVHSSFTRGWNSSVFG